MLKHACAKINDFDTCPRLVLEQHIFWFDVGMDDVIFPEENKGIQDLNSESPNMRHLNWLEMIELHQVKQADTKQFRHDANMFSKHDEVLNSYNVFLVIDIFLLCPHQDVYLIQGELHMLLFWLDYLDGNRLFVLMVKCSHDLSKCPTSQTL